MKLTSTEYIWFTESMIQADIVEFQRHLQNFKDQWSFKFNWSHWSQWSQTSLFQWLKYIAQWEAEEVPTPCLIRLHLRSQRFRHRLTDHQLQHPYLHIIHVCKKSSLSPSTKIWTTLNCKNYDTVSGHVESLSGGVIKNLTLHRMNKYFFFPAEKGDK